MTARERFAAELAALPDEDVPAYLSARSGLPGPRGNLELLAAFGDVAAPGLVVRLADDEDEYLRCCGTAALGRLLLEAGDEPAADGGGVGDARAGAGARVGDEPMAGGGGVGGEPGTAVVGVGDEQATGRGPTRAALEATLTERARDPLWRVREGAAMAGQRLGAGDPAALAALADRWLATGDPLVARAAVAALCEPPILTSPLLRAAALDACAAATDLLRAVPADRRRDPDVRTLRQGLAYCWSVAVAADPEAGLPRFAALAADQDPDVAWVARENAKKTRLSRLLRP